MPAGGAGEDGEQVTAFLHLRYVRPVPTGTTVLLRAWYRRVEGRRAWVDGCVEDELGCVLAEAEALFLPVRGAGGAKS